jgi:putative transposase
MKKTRYSEEQIVNILKEGEAGMAVTDLCRKYGMSDATYYNWKAKYAGMATSDVKRLKQLEDENRRLKHLVADLTLDNQALKEVISKNF